MMDNNTKDGIRIKVKFDLNSIENIYFQNIEKAFGFTKDIKKEEQNCDGCEKKTIWVGFDECNHLLCRDCYDKLEKSTNIPFDHPSNFRVSEFCIYNPKKNQKIFQLNVRLKYHQFLELLKVVNSVILEEYIV